jgi:hypothetical protein
MAELSDLKSNIGRDMETLHNNQQQLGTAYSALARPTTDSVPSFINTDSSTVVTQSQQVSVLKDMISDLRKDMALMVAGNGSKGGDGGNGGGTGAKPRIKPTTWRQWNKWCWTHGSHLLHDSATCEQKWRKVGHNETATKENPVGRNISRDHLYMQWCSHVDNSAHATKGE